MQIFIRISHSEAHIRNAKQAIDQAVIRLRVHK